MNCRVCVLALLVALSTGCTHMPDNQRPGNAAIFRLEMLDAERVASTLSLYSATHDHACWEQLKTTNASLNVASRQYFLLLEYPHPTTQATALILGRAAIRKAINAAQTCSGAFVGSTQNR